MTGYFVVYCDLDDGSRQYNKTTALPALASLPTILAAINEACPNLRDKVELWEGNHYPYLENGRSVNFRFNIPRKPL